MLTSLSVTSLAITYQPFFSGLLATLIQVTVSVVIGLEISIFVGILSPLGSILGVLGFINIFVGIGIIL